MKEKLLIINLEDNRFDSELNAETLERDNIACEMVRVETRESFLAAIEKGGADIILSDYSLPLFDGLSALAMARERCPDLPFVFVTGAMGEEIAIESLRSGATDYVLKQNLSRLAPVVRRALREAEDRRERARAVEQLRVSLREKEVLLREIFHRTRNNMQVIKGLISLQSQHIEDERVLNILRDTDNRIDSMALVHQQLCDSGDLSNIEFGKYVRELAASLMASYKVSHTQISLKFDLEDISLTIDSASPCGLILNEIISNALKHAFPNLRKGEIAISLCRTDDGKIRLGIRDNGIGIPESFDIRNSGSLGLQLVMGLGETQLNGKVELKRNNGTEVIIVFTEPKHPKRI